MDSKEAPRIDKWLWAVRAFKTRSQASEACRAGKVKVDDQPVKPSRMVTKDMIITVQSGPIKRQFKVIELLHNRVGAKLVSQYMEDLTPEEEYQKLEMIRSNQMKRDRGAGRPTKKERREMDSWFDWE